MSRYVNITTFVNVMCVSHKKTYVNTNQSSNFNQKSFLTTLTFAPISLG